MVRLAVGCRAKGGFDPPPQPRYARRDRQSKTTVSPLDALRMRPSATAPSRGRMLVSTAHGFLQGPIPPPQGSLLWFACLAFEHYTK